MRGKAKKPTMNRRKRRITPACAGKSFSTSSGCASGRDHPRVCGEKVVYSRYDQESTGSPPRVRGKAGRKSSRGRMDGITPACAGKRQVKPCSPRTQRDHPRVCGEKAPRQRLHLAMLGSPPRVRGKVHRAEVRPSFLGITPACAGKSQGIENGQVPPQDHPRVCGEKSGNRKRASPAAGSPPRVRGKDRPESHRPQTAGITPACAGKSRLLFPVHRFPWDHPRVCGEKKNGPKSWDMKKGSPPRVRGKAVSFIVVSSKGRITPACAGKRNSAVKVSSCH